MRQPDVTQQSVIPLLVQNQLAVASQSRVDLAVAIEVGSVVPGSVAVVQVKHGALANVDEQANVLAASGGKDVSLLKL